LTRLHDLTNVRFIVLHLEILPPAERPIWEEAVASGRLQRVWSDASTWILELPDFARRPRYLEALRSPQPRAETLTGLSRAPLELTPNDGVLEAKEPEPFLFAPGATRLVRLSLQNASDVHWAGFDDRPEGLVLARYAFLGEDGGVVVRGSASLAEDVPARSRVRLAVPIRPPAEPGRYRLSIDLVQSQGGEERALPLAPVEIEVEVRKLLPRPAQSPAA
jgi:hypothetical protein